MSNVNSAFALSLVIIATGYCFKKLRIVTEDDGKVISRIIFNITLPALILKTFSKSTIIPTLGLLPLICVAYSGLVLMSCFCFYKGHENPDKGLLLISVVGFNNGLFAFPIIESIWGENGIQYLAMFDIGNAFILFGVNYIVGTLFSSMNPSGKGINFIYVVKSLFRSIPLISYIIALSINIIGLSLPLFIHDLIGVLARANMALALIVLGIFLNLNFEKTKWKSILQVLLIRYCFGLGCGFILYWFLPFNLFYRKLILIALCLPIGFSTLPYSVEFKYDQKLAGTLTNLTIIISFVLMWTIISTL